MTPRREAALERKLPYVEMLSYNRSEAGLP